LQNGNHYFYKPLKRKTQHIGATMPRRNSERIPLKPLPTSALSLLQEIQFDMLDTLSNCEEFDKGKKIAGIRLRQQLLMVVKKIQYLRNEILRMKYYREAVEFASGDITVIKDRKFKEMKYGSITEVAKFQNSQINKRKIRRGD